MNEAKYDKYHKNGNEQKKFRLIFIGCAGVGKTSIITRFVNNQMISQYNPTNSINIFKKLFNFYPKQDEQSEYAYIELVDTVSIETNEIPNSNWYELFTPVRLSELEDKPPSEKIKKYINYEIFPSDYKGIDSKKDNDSIEEDNKKNVLLGNTDRKIFTRTVFMAYIFVFDYNKMNTFSKCLKYAKNIKNDLLNKYEDKNKIPLFIFIGNKYEGFLPSNLVFNQVNLRSKIFDLFEEENENFDSFYKQLLNEHIFQNEKECKDSLYIINCKNNFCVRETFHSIFETIQQERKNLWNVKIAEKEEDDPYEDRQRLEEENNSKSFLDHFMFFCCSDRKKLNRNMNENAVLYIETKDQFGKSLFKENIENENMMNSSNTNKSNDSLEEEDNIDDGKIIIPEPDHY